MTKQLTFSAIIARDEGLERVSTRSQQFMANGILAIAKLPPGEYTGEQIRLLLFRQHISPHHHNAWGALIMSAVRKGLLFDTGKVANMQTRASHARKTTVYTTIRT
jgi:hypothetical protein